MPRKSGFVATASLRNSLQKVLIDLIALHNLGKQAHWNIVGPNFRDLHLNLDELVDIAREAADATAERMRALNTVPDGRVKTVADKSSVAELPAGKILTHDAIKLVVAAINECVATIRRQQDSVDEDDPASADMLNGFVLALEQQAWFLGAELQEPDKGSQKT